MDRGPVFSDNSYKMWLLISLIFINTVANNKTFILENRIDIGGLPINVLDGLLALGVLVSWIPRNDRNASRADRVHPMLPSILAIFAVVALLDFVSSQAHSLPLRRVVTPMRNLLCMPVSVWLGYRFLASPRSALRISYFHLLASVLSAIIAILFLRDIATGSHVGGFNFDAFRVTSVGGDDGLAGAAILLFGISAGFRIFPLVPSLIMVAICGVAIALLPHRSNWVMAAMTIFFAVFFLARGKFGRKMAVTVGGTIALALALMTALQLISSVTGKDMGAYLGDRVLSLLPGDQPGTKANKPWATRLPGATRELEIWTGSPVWGGGFGAQEMTGPDVGFRHTPWISTMAEGGLISLAGYAMVFGSMMLIGRRMVREQTDRGSVLLGATAAVVGFAAFVVGFLTMHWNTQRPAISIGLVCGMMLRCRAMQLHQQHQELEAGSPALPSLLPAQWQDFHPI